MQSTEYVTSPGFGIVSYKKPETPMTRFTAGAAILLMIAEFMGSFRKLHLSIKQQICRAKFSSAVPGCGDFSGALSMGQRPHE